LEKRRLPRKGVFRKVKQSLPPALFVADAAGLDFLNTKAKPGAVVLDWLDDGEAFLRWMEAARLVTPDDVETVRRQAAPGEIDAVAAQARALREWFRGFVAPRLRNSLKPEDLAVLAPLNAVLARDARYSQIAPAPGASPPFLLAERRANPTPAALLQPIAAAMAELVCTADFAQTKQCEGESCTLLFLDTTRGKARRWCSMAMCGNRAKQAAYRRRSPAR
jgi:predicted RNA-binding Zn ribbon-like protein